MRISLKKIPNIKNIKIGKREVIVLLALLVFAVVAVLVVRNSDSAQKGKRYSQSFKAMDSFITITCYGKNGKEAVSQVKKEMSRLDKQFSKNAIAGTEIIEMLQLALTLSEASEGAYDITSKPLSEAWGFSSGKNKVPTEEELAEALALVDYRGITISGDTVTLKEGQKLDLSSIAMGYAVEKCTEIAKSLGVKSALFSWGENVQCIGKKPDGKAWRVGVKNPKDKATETIGILEVEDMAVATRGVYEHQFTDKETKETYHFLLDTATGYPVDNGMLSVTVLSTHAALAEALSTALILMGPEKATEFWKQEGQKQGWEFEMIYITEDYVYATEGISDIFSCDEDLIWIKR